MATIKLHYSLARAYKVLRAINTSGKLPKDIADLFEAESWDNCREQGLCLQGSWFIPANNPDTNGRLTYVRARIFIGEARGSDQTVVVTDDNPEGIGNKPTHEAWEKGRVYFGEDAIGATVNHIIKEMRRLTKGRVL